MRAFVILCLVAWAAADVSELPEAGYDYRHPSGSGSGLFDGGVGDLSAPSSLKPSVSNLASGPGGLDFGGASNAPTISKRFFTYSAQDSTDDDDDDDVSRLSGGLHKNYDVVFAKAPSSSLKSAVKALSRYAGEHQTAVYVLSQQLSAAQIGDALRASGVKPNKPQVHFIKYKTPEEAAHAQQQVRSQYDALGGSTHDGGEESAPVQSVVGSLGHHHRRPSSHEYRYRQPSHGHGVSGGIFGLGTATSSKYLPPSRYLPPRY